jgi:hypothetical protein
MSISAAPVRQLDERARGPHERAGSKVRELDNNGLPSGSNTMRFMIIVKASKESEAGVMPEEKLMATMAAYHEELGKAGILIDAAGLQASSKGWRVKYQGGKRTVVDGPFAETKELIAGYTLINVKSRAEALEWSKRYPNPLFDKDCEIEVRQFFELEDFAQGEAVDRFREMEAAQKK